MQGFFSAYLVCDRNIICSKMREVSLALLLHLGYNSKLFVFLEVLKDLF